LKNSGQGTQSSRNFEDSFKDHDRSNEKDCSQLDAFPDDSQPFLKFHPHQNLCQEGSDSHGEEHAELKAKNQNNDQENRPDAEEEVERLVRKFWSLFSLGRNRTRLKRMIKPRIAARMVKRIENSLQAGI
jgi:hypothetical protein